MEKIFKQLINLQISLHITPNFKDNRLHIAVSKSGAHETMTVDNAANIEKVLQTLINNLCLSLAASRSVSS